MTIHGSGAFSFTGWEEATYSEASEGSKLAAAKVTNDFHGTIEGQGTLTYVLTYLPDGEAVFTGYEQISGSVDGRSGSFVLLHEGHVTNATSPSDFVVSTNVSVVPGSGSGALAQLTGSGSFTSRHEDTETRYRFDYDLN
jgi:hypothetical protein